MLNKSNALESKHRVHSPGESAVDGLLAGGLAGALMTVYLIVLGLTWGDAPGVTLNRFTAGSMETNPVVGGLTHLAVSAIYGAIFGLIWYVLQKRLGSLGAIAAGVIYAALLFGVSELVMLPAAQSPLLEIPALHWGIAHLIYGLVLGALIQRGHK